MATIGLVITGLAFLVSLLFNLLQLKWRKDEQAARADDKAEQKRKDDEREAEQRLKEQVAPLFFNFDGTPGSILVTGSQHSSQGPFMYVWGLVTVVNRTQLPMKITPLRLLMAGRTRTTSSMRKPSPRRWRDRTCALSPSRPRTSLIFRAPSCTRPAGASPNRDHQPDPRVPAGARRYLRERTGEPAQPDAGDS